MSDRTCTVPTCERGEWARGWCSSHYPKWYRYGDPLYEKPKHPNGFPVDLVIPCDELILEHVAPVGECLEWRGWRNPKGYGMLSVPWATRRQMAHRVSWTLAYGPIPEGMMVCHHCDNPPCVLPDHLFLGTAADNNRDRCLKGRPHGTAKLTAGLVLEIRSKRAKGALISDLAKEYGVGVGSIKKIIRRETYRYL